MGRWLFSHPGRGAAIALLAIVLIAAMRYDQFASVYNFGSLLRYNASLGMIAIGMTLVLMTGGLDLSVGANAALTSIIAAMLSPYGLTAGLGGALLVGSAIGLLNGFLIVRLSVAPFIATLATLIGCRSAALLVSQEQTVSASWDTAFIELGQRELYGLPLAGLLVFAVAAIAGLMLAYSRFGRHIMAVGGSESVAFLMGVNVKRTKYLVYLISGALAGLAGAILAASSGAGQPTEGLGWELFAIAAAVVGGTSILGGAGTVSGTIVGLFLLSVIFNVLNFENGYGWITLNPYWQAFLRGLILLLVVIIQGSLDLRRKSVRA